MGGGRETEAAEDVARDGVAEEHGSANEFRRRERLVEHRLALGDPRVERGAEFRLDFEADPVPVGRARLSEIAASRPARAPENGVREGRLSRAEARTVVELDPVMGLDEGSQSGIVQRIAKGAATRNQTDATGRIGDPVFDQGRHVRRIEHALDVASGNLGRSQESHEEVRLIECVPGPTPERPARATQGASIRIE